MIYFDNAATTFPKPPEVARCVQESFTLYGANPGRSGHNMAMDTAVQIYACREDAATLFHTDQPEDVVFCQNATHAVNLALKGVLQRGDHVIISDLEHNAVLRPVHALAKRGLITYSVAEVDAENDDVTVKNFLNLIRPNTKMIACIHASNVFGIRLPVKQLGQLAEERDILFLVDAAQTAGVVDIDMADCHIDFLCTAGHKSLYGPSGTGLMVSPLGCVLTTIVEGGTGSFSSEYDQPHTKPARLESGTVNTAGILGLGAGIRYVRERGIDAIYAHEMDIAEYIYNGLNAIPGVQLYTGPLRRGRHLPVVSFTLPGIHSERVGELLNENGIAVRAGLHCAPLAHKKMGTLESGTVRVSIGAFNTQQEAAELCYTVKKIAQKHCNTTGMC